MIYDNKDVWKVKVNDIRGSDLLYSFIYPKFSQKRQEHLWRLKEEFKTPMCFIILQPSMTIQSSQFNGNRATPLSVRKTISKSSARRLNWSRTARCLKPWTPMCPT